MQGTINHSLIGFSTSRLFQSKLLYRHSNQNPEETIYDMSTKCVFSRLNY